MYKKYSRYLLVLVLLPIGHAAAVKKRHILKKKPPTVQSIKDGPATVFIHGTIFPIISRFTHGVAYPDGLISYADCPQPNRLTRMAETLCNACPEEFPLGSFYFYCWPGNLNFKERKRATQKLYSLLIKHKGPLTLIAHSHGCNVALYLAELEDSTSFTIDRLILCACPVQKATAHLVKSPIFKSIYSFYSSADVTQILDPQGLYEETKKISKDCPLFSERLFEDAPNLIQARVLMNRQSPGHQSFLTQRFLSRLPSLLMRMDESATQKNERHCILNIPPAPESPHLVEKIEVAQRYIPRTPRGRQIRNDKQSKAPLQA